MQNKNQIPDPGSLKIKAKLASFIAAGSLAVLTVLSSWSFELRSILRLFLMSGVLSIGIWVGLYYFLYRKLRDPISFDYKFLIICIISSVFFSFRIVPPQHNIYIRHVITIVITAFMFLFFYLSFLTVLINNEKIHLGNIFPTLVFVCGFAGMMIIIINSLSIRLYSDDFCYAVQLENMGFWDSALWFYNSWSPRFFSNFLVMGLVHEYRVPLFFLFFILFSFYFSLLSIVKNSPTKRWLLALASAFFIPFAVFTVTPDLYKSLFWIASTLTLLPLLVMIPVYLAMIGHFLSTNPPNSRWLLIVGLFLSFAITTTHEVASLGWLGMHIIGLIWFYMARSKNIHLRNYLLVGLLAALIGLIVMLNSPGIDLRVNARDLPPSPPLQQIISSTIQNFLHFINTITWPKYLYHGVARPSWYFIIAAAGLGWLTDTPIRRHLGTAALVLLSTIAMATVSFFPAAYILSATLPLRTQFIPTLYLVFGVFIFGICLPRVTNNLLRTSVAILIMMIMVFGSLISLSQLILTVEPVRQYARDWDLRDKTVRTTSEMPQRLLDVPWDEYEQDLECVQLYYQTRK